MRYFRRPAAYIITHNYYVPGRNCLVQISQSSQLSIIFLEGMLELIRFGRLPRVCTLVATFYQPEYKYKQCVMPTVLPFMLSQLEVKLFVRPSKVIVGEGGAC